MCVCAAYAPLDIEAIGRELALFMHFGRTQPDPIEDPLPLTPEPQH